MTAPATTSPGPEQLREQLRAVMTRAEDLVSTAERENRDLTEVESTEHAELASRAERLGPQIRQAELQKVHRALASGTAAMESGFGGGGATPTRDAALRLVDRRDDTPDEVRHAMATAVDKAQPGEQERMARYIRTAGSEAYERAFKKILRDPTAGYREFTDDELRAYQAVQHEARALNLTDANGGFLVPAVVDFSVQLSSAGSINPLRQVARKVTTTGDTWSGITSAGVTASWDAEAAQVSDDSPTFANPSIPVHKGAAYVQASLEVAMDANIGSILGPLFADARDQLEATGHTLGTGSGQPKGIITAVAAVGGSVVTSAGSALTVADTTANQNALPARWRPRAKWMANLAIINQGRQLIAGTGLTTPLVTDNGGQPQMMGWPVHENSVMDGTIAAGTTNDYVLLSGDFSQFVIVDRIGLTLQYIPAVFSTTNNRPTGEVGWYAFWRTGSDVLVADAFRLTNYSG